MTLPPDLIEYLTAGRMALFIGGKALPGPARPSQADLARILAQRFLGAADGTRSLSEIVQLAESETDLISVQGVIADELMTIEPSEAESYIPTFCWIAIATTRLDLAVERAYDRSTDALQRCVPFTSDHDSVEDLLSDDSAVMYLKLHGSITSAMNARLPLIVDTDQYPTHLPGRARLYERFDTIGHEHPVLFAGESLSDSDLRAMLLRYTASNTPRPRSYVVVRSFTAADERLWGNRNVTCIAAPFAELLSELNKLISPDRRKLARYVNTGGHPITRRLAVSTDRPFTEDLTRFLTHDVDYIDKGQQLRPCSPRDFYRGHFDDWGPIEQNLDVHRSVTDVLLSEAILTEETEAERQSFYLLKGHAGSGKTVILRRLAWDAATEFDRLCLYARENGSLRYRPLQEIYTLCKQRIYLFVDGVSARMDELEGVIAQARARKLPLTIVATARQHTWNAVGARLADLLTQTYEVRYLNEKEIDALIDLLVKHKSAGHLALLSREEQREALSKKAGRQLLVALHEATLGRPFSDILFDEYQSITSGAAKSLYLTVCVLHRLGIKTRAGAVSRIHGIPFRTFKNDLFGPLDSIVFAREDRSIRDFVYESRHPHIAELVFERVLVDPQARHAEYARILDNLDLAYAADRDAFWRMLNARELRQLFADPAYCRSLYDLAVHRYPDQAALMQQYAVFEMHAADGRLDVASELLRSARTLDPKSPSLLHSVAELLLKKASRATHSAERAKFRSEAKAVLRPEFGAGAAVSYTYHSFIKIELDELQELLAEAGDETLQRKIRDIEQLIADALQRAPGDEYILDSEARLARFLKNSPRASAALQRAFTANKGSPYVALRLAKLLGEQGDHDGAITVLKECLEARPAEKEVHFALAQRLMVRDGDSNPTVLYHLRQSFTKGDTRYEAQFWCARALYITNEISAATDLFKDLADANVSAVDRNRARGVMSSQGERARYSGVIKHLEQSYAYIQRDRTGDRIYVRAAPDHLLGWSSLRSNNRVTFEIGFNYRGPVAQRLDFESRTKQTPQPAGTLPTPPPFRDGVSRPIDIGIVIALREEFREFANRVKYESVRDETLGHYYYRFQYPFDAEDGYHCVATMIGDMGQERAVLATERLVSRWQPAVVAIIGIAGSLHRDVMLGDVVVASQVDLYAEAAKAAGKAGEPFVLQPGGTAHATAHGLLELVRNIEFSQATTYGEWLERCRQNHATVMAADIREKLITEGLMRERPSLTDIRLASGSFVAASPEFIAWLRTRDRGYKAVDMESGGFMIAATARDRPLRTIVLRGISDYSDDRKAELEEATSSCVRRYAMMNALEFLLTLLDGALVERVERSILPAQPNGILAAAERSERSGDRR